MLEICLTAIRQENGISNVHKSCKQKMACDGLLRQNGHLCQRHRSLVLCFHCCEGNLCNQVVDWPELTGEKRKSVPSVFSWVRSDSFASGPDPSPSPESLDKATAKKIRRLRLKKKAAMYKRSLMSNPNVDPWKMKLKTLREKPIYVGQVKPPNGNLYPTNLTANASAALMMMNSAPGACGIPRMTGISIQKLGFWPTGASFLIQITDTTTATKGWTVLVALSRALPPPCNISVWAAILQQQSNNQQAFLLENKPHNADISSHMEFNITFVVGNCPSGFSANLYSGVTGFYDHSVTTSGQCGGQITPATTTVATGGTSGPSSTTGSVQTTGTAPTSVPATIGPPGTPPVTTATTASPSSCSRSLGGYTLLGPAYPGFSSDIRVHANVAITNVVATTQKRDWAVKIVFNVPVLSLLCWEVQVANRSADGRVFLLHSLSWYDVLADRMVFDVIVSYSGVAVPVAAVYYCEPSGNADLSIPQGIQYPYGAKVSSTNIIQSTSGPQITTAQAMTTISPQLRCNDTRGLLPPVSKPTIVAFTPTPASDNCLYDYNEILHKSILFYEAQRSGRLPLNNRILWRGDSNLHDGCDVGFDLTGGWHDGAENVKYGFPMAATITTLAWGMLEFEDAYKDANEWLSALEMLKWGTDYLLKTHTAPNQLWGQVGDPLADQNFWTRPEQLTTPRTAFQINETAPGSDLAGETSAAMSAASMVFKNVDPQYSDTLLTHATQLYEFANIYRGHYDASILTASRVYPSLSGFGDELAWAAVWLSRAKNDVTYLDDARQKLWEFALVKRPYDFSWDNKLAGVQLLLAMLTNDTTFHGDVENFLNHCLTTSSVSRTPGGLAFFSTFGTNSYAANAALIALIAVSKIKPPLPNADRYFNFAKTQIHALLGSGDGGRSYVVGFGKDPPTQPYHAASSCPQWSSPFPSVCNRTAFNSPSANPHVLYGALVGGPGKGGNYKYDRREFINNEVSINYNAGFQSAVAGLKHFIIKNRKP